MLTLYTSTGAVPLRCDDYYVRELASGLDELIFSISIHDPDYPSIQEESSIREDSDGMPSNYLVKAIDAGPERANIKCQIDLDAWKATMTVDYDSGSLTVGGIVRSVAPSDWTVIDSSGMTYSRTIKLTSATPLDVLEQCRDTFDGATFRFDNIQKTVTIVDMTAGTNVGAFVTRDLNLRKNNYKGKSTGFITRLYAYGKDGLTFAPINGGKEYVDNNTYSSRVICGFWKDERYTVAANLLQAAQDRLAALAVPQRSYDCDVVDLAAIDPTKYSYLSFPLFSVVSLIDQTRSNAKIDHTVVELWRYPYLPQKNKVVLSTAAPRIQSQVSQIVNSITNANSIYQQQQTSAIQSAVDNATAHITGADGGYVRAIYDANQNWTELVIMNTNDILTASKVWRFNLGGLGYSPNGYNGPYTTAITMDGAIVADFITTGTLDASRVSVTNLNASNITTGTLSADYISGGTINASTINVTNLNASNLTTGTIPADRVGANSIAGGKLVDSTITVTQLANGAVTGAKVDYQTLTDTNYGRLSVSTGAAVNYLTNGAGYGYTANDIFSGNDTAVYMPCRTLTVGGPGVGAMSFRGEGVSWGPVTVGSITYRVLMSTGG